MTIEEIVKMWETESNAACDCIVEILEAHLETLGATKRFLHCKKSPKFDEYCKLFVVNLERSEKQWGDLLETIKKTREGKNEK